MDLREQLYEMVERYHGRSLYRDRDSFNAIFEAAQAMAHADVGPDDLRMIVVRNMPPRASYGTPTYPEPVVIPPSVDDDD